MEGNSREGEEGWETGLGTSPKGHAQGRRNLGTLIRSESSPGLGNSMVLLVWEVQRALHSKQDGAQNGDPEVESCNVEGSKAQAWL